MVRLRSLESGDIDAVHALISRIDVVRHMRLPLCSREESEKFLRDSLLESTSDPWKSIVRAISDNAGRDLVGLCGLVILRGAEEGEIWYLVEPGSWGKGIATEAAKLLLDYGFGELGLHRIWATLSSREPRIGASPGEGRHESGRVPRQERQDTWSMEEQFSICYARRGMEPRLLQFGTRIRVSCRVTRTPPTLRAHAARSSTVWCLMCGVIGGVATAVAKSLVHLLWVKKN